jgi:hypothetical protein
MPTIPEPQYVISAEEVIWGLILIGATMICHGVGMTAAVSANWRMRDWGFPSPLRNVTRMVLVTWVIVFVHLLDVLIWAAFFLFKGALAVPSVAYYFSLLEYTTVGSAYKLPFQWRLLEGMIAMAGLMTFAWSTAVFMTIVQSIQNKPNAH